MRNKVSIAQDYSPFGAPLPGRSYDLLKEQSRSIIVNNTFASTVEGWAVSGSATVAVVSGQLKITYSAANAGAKQYAGTLSGKDYVYQLKVDFTGGTSPMMMVVKDNLSGTTLASLKVTTSGTYKLKFKAIGGNTYVYAQCSTVYSAPAKFFYIDNVIVEEDKTLQPGYSFGFNGKYKDDETYGSGNSYDYGARIYDSRLARFLSVDPKSNNYPFWSPYNYAANNPIRLIDIEGEGVGDPIGQSYNQTGNVMIIVLDSKDAKFNVDRQKEMAPGWDFVVVSSLGDAVSWLNQTYGKDGGKIDNLFVRTHGTDYNKDDPNSGNAMVIPDGDVHDHRTRTDLQSTDFAKNPTGIVKTDLAVSQIKEIGSYLSNDAKVLFSTCNAGQDPALGVEIAKTLAATKDIVLYTNKDLSHPLNTATNTITVDTDISMGLSDGWSFTKKSQGEYKSFSLGTGFNMKLGSDGSINMSKVTDKGAGAAAAGKSSSSKSKE